MSHLTRRRRQESQATFWPVEVSTALKKGRGGGNDAGKARVISLTTLLLLRGI
ncbi:hypothetical protein CC85DRAFT_287584 [Cutaneotrichosporon oleaginosum]|uniref:Uncharacterized protein n=1 Tax=Cutaneotrichosporon oleaginosum TaxID=879819 RepID=A0A0J0XGZ3_9TREE|nr:uncharacterized protein CC85DRAFT_287584 [Cutaneotrichosporon oleaginosum]KLT40360.1 hypothetical protein CC85DRAFT_287584 [Cutaneotrichosporon oleaginosum]